MNLAIKTIGQQPRSVQRVALLGAELSANIEFVAQVSDAAQYVAGSVPSRFLQTDSECGLLFAEVPSRIRRISRNNIWLFV